VKGPEGPTWKREGEQGWIIADLPRLLQLWKPAGTMSEASNWKQRGAVARRNVLSRGGVLHMLGRDRKWLDSWKRKARRAVTDSLVELAVALGKNGADEFQGVRNWNDVGARFCLFPSSQWPWAGLVFCLCFSLHCYSPYSPMPILGSWFLLLNMWPPHICPTAPESAGAENKDQNC
jgi:hypothetical protein